MFVSIIALVAETISFSWLLIIGEKFKRAVIWRQLVIFKSFVKPQMKVKSSSGINIYGLYIL